jgi:hypothetical protein
MIKNILTVLFLSGSTLLFAQDPLTTGQKLNDFEFLYSELKASYPYFGVNKRQNGIDWLSNEKAYRKKIKSAKTDKEFLKAVNSILNDLNNGHTDTYPTIIYDYFYNGYKQAVESYPFLVPYVKELEKTNKEKSAYWAKLMADGKEEKTPDEGKNTENNPGGSDKNVNIQYDKENSLAMIGIKSFSYENIEKDAETLAEFFKDVHVYDKLIIDIRGNTGGDETYWKQHIVPFLIGSEISYPIVFAFKKSDRVISFKPQYKENSELEDFDFKNYPKEVKTGGYAFYSDSVSIPQNDAGKKYEGNIYLLVDKAVYSSAESLAYFCKATGFAKVVGERTGGDGIGTDPLLLTLPNSGIVVRFTGEMALNPDGSPNEETKTEPDLKSDKIKGLSDIRDIYRVIKTATNKG